MATFVGDGTFKVLALVATEVLVLVEEVGLLLLLLLLVHKASCDGRVPVGIV